MRIEWLGHACFRLSSARSRVVLDPYEDGRVPGLGLLRTDAEVVLCSHDHGDHNAVGCVHITGCACDFEIETLDSFHDEQEGALRGTNKIHILSDGELRVAHLGDLGHWPSEAVCEKLRGLDALLLPVGGYYTIDAATAHRLAEALQPRVVVPMHYRLPLKFGYKEIGTLRDFLALRADVVKYDGNALELCKDISAQTAVLRYERP